MTASEMFGVPVAGMPPEVRRRAKAINFGIIYGISAFGLANQLGISREEAGAYIKRYFERFPGIRDLYGSNEILRARERLCDDNFWAQMPLSAGERVKSLGARFQRTCRDQRADLGFCCRYYQARDGAHGRCVGESEAFGANAVAGP